MFWVIFPIIAFVVTLWVWRHTYTDREIVYEREERSYFGPVPCHYEYYDECRLPLRRWHLLVMIVLYAIPVSNIAAILSLYLFFRFSINEKDLYFHVEGNKFTKAMYDFFTKDVFAKSKSKKSV